MRFVLFIANLGPRVRIALASIVILLLITLVFPFKTTIVPQWSLRVIDQSGSPVARINVTEHWQHYLLEDAGHEELLQTGADGRVSFPERTIRASLLRRFLATLSRFANAGMDAKREPYASVVTWGSPQHSTTVLLYDPEQPLISEVVVHSFR